MRVIDQPQLPPGACYLTRSSKGPFIDTLRDTGDRDDVMPDGRIILCRDVVLDMAAMFGGASPEVVDELRGEVVHYRTEALAANERARELQTALEAAVAAGYVIPDVADTPGVREAIEAGVFPGSEPETEEVTTP